MLKGMKYGLGFGLEMAPGADGAAPTVRRLFWGGSFSTRFWIDPPHEVASVIMTQNQPMNPAAGGVFRQALDAAIEK